MFAAGEIETNEEGRCRDTGEPPGCAVYVLILALVLWRIVEEFSDLRRDAFRQSWIVSDIAPLDGM